MVDADIGLEYVPALHGVGDPHAAGHQLPGGQGRQVMDEKEPTTTEKEPDGHAMHVLMVLEPMVAENRPAGHDVGVDMPKLGQ